MARKAPPPGLVLCARLDTCAPPTPEAMAPKASTFWTDALCAGMCGVYSFFGVTLAISMRDFWGPNSPGFSYWNVADASGQWFARAMGILMAAVTTSPYWAGVDKHALKKVYLVVNMLWLPMFVEAAFYSGKATAPPKTNVLPINMWITQLPVAGMLLLANLMSLGEGKTTTKTRRA